MLIEKRFLPFFNSESGASGNTGDNGKNNSGKGKTEINEPDDIQTKIEKDLETSRAKIFTEEKEDDGVIAGKTSETDEKDTSKSKIEGVQKIDDTFIQGAAASELFKGLDNEAVVKVLNNIKDTQVDAKVLKNYVHGQVKLEEYNRTKDPKTLEDKESAENFETFQERTDEDFAENLEQLNDQEKEQVNQAKVLAVYNKLRSKYKDITLDDLKDEDAVNNYVADLQVNKPLLADDFKTDFRATNKQIDKETNEYVDRALNFGDYMRKDAKEIVDKFNAMLQSKGIDPKDLETEIDEKWIVQNIVKKKDGKLNTDMITYYRNKIPTLNKAAFYSALLDTFDPRITELTKKAGISEYIAGKRKKEANPSISASDVGGKTRVELPASDVIDTKEFPGFENIDKILEQNRKKIFENNESVYPDV